MITDQDRRALVAELLRPKGLYFTRADSLRVTSFNAAAGVRIRLAGRFHDEAAREPRDFHGPHVPNTDRTVATQDYPMGDGWLEGLTVIVEAGTPVWGQTFVRVDAMRGRGASATILATIIQGLVTANHRLAWPGSPLYTPLERPGIIRSITGTDPAAGADVSETVPTGARWRLIALRALLVTDATVANRRPSLVLDDGANIYAQLPGPTDMAASTTWTNVWGEGAQAQAGGPIPGSVAPVPATHRLLTGHRLRTSTANLQAGDNWGVPVYLVEEWLDP